MSLPEDQEPTVPPRGGISTLLSVESGEHVVRDGGGFADDEHRKILGHTAGQGPAIACALLASLELIEQGDARRSHLRQLATQLREGLAETRWQLIPSPTAIQPVMIGENFEVLRVANALFEHGLWVPAIRPPTVPKGTARLRVSLSSAHRTEHVAQLIDALRSLV